MMSQSKMYKFLRPMQEIDSDCYIVESEDKTGNNKLSNGPSDSVVVHAATPKRHPKINDNDDDDDDDDKPLAPPQGQNSPAIKTTVTATKRRRGQIAARKPTNRTRQSRTQTKPVGSSDE